MRYYCLSYRKSHYVIGKKYIKALSSAYAIKQSRLKNIIECYEITKEYYDKMKMKQKELKVLSENEKFIK